ncbi:MAG: hypothetical protein RL404_2501 [Pseudomonadota bacterium]
MSTLAVMFPGSPSASLARTFLAFRDEFLWIGAFSLVANVLSLAPTLYMLQVYDRVMLSQSELTLVSLTLFFTVFVVVTAIAEWVRARLLIRAGVRFDEQLNTRIFFANFQSHLEQGRAEGGNAFAALTRLRQFLTGNGVVALFDLPWTLIYLAVLFAMHPLLGWFGIAFSFVLGVHAYLTHQLSAKQLAHAVRAEGDTSAYLAGKLRNAEIVEALGMLGNLKRRWLTLYLRHARASWDAQERTGVASAFSKFLQYSQQSLILALGAWLAIRGELSAGAMVASNVLMGNALRPIGVLMSACKEFVQARQACEDIGALLEDYPEQPARHAANAVIGQVTLRQLGASGSQGGRTILEDIDMRFEAGEVVGIVGPSGSGKSTLARCLVGIWPRTSGQVLLDGVDIRDWSQDALGPRVGYLPQDIELFDGTVAENICRFSKTDSPAIIEAAKRADIHDMILRLPQGYDTPVGQAGKLLSGGQRQRLALARALYGRPDLIVLDEPNANLDEAGEAALAAAIRQLKKDGKTVFMVVHQRQILALADRVVVMANGRITQSGRTDASVAGQAYAIH